jgi:hypothetical protein
MRSARIKRNKRNKISKKIKSFLIYSFLGLVVSGFIANFFLSNIFEYSFALAKSGGVVDFKSDDKFALAMLSVNSLNEVKEMDVLVFDKRNTTLNTFRIDLSTILTSQDGEFALKDTFKNISKDNNVVLKNLFQDNFGMVFGQVLVMSPSVFNDYLSIVSGSSYMTDLPKLTEIPNISLRDSYLMYSFAKNLDLKDKREFQVKSLAGFDSEVRDIYLDSTLGKEGLSITVINATSINGLGKTQSRKILNMGGRVVDVSSSDSVENESLLIYKKESKTLDYLANFLGISKKVSYEELGLKYPEIVKSDIVVVVGIDKN